MIGSTRQLTVYACAAPTDMRKSFDTLSAVVTLALKRDPLSGDLFLFTSKNRKRAKVLMWDGTGLCVYAKRLEQGRFACLWEKENSPALKLTMSELQLFLEGSELIGRVRLSPAPFFFKESQKNLDPRIEA
ncbi:MAG: IS66 family insertion sequence element accessory protein TnpB [Acidobacteria bacterium]|nr:IS66 family insertion sequence element accessory protein TnpB [Acidobacteriota bacterium]MCI0656919.1 IS66 family insertion sequence element accessory protein TnpB [Acidobacteriota bacterium]